MLCGTVASNKTVGSVTLERLGGDDDVSPTTINYTGSENYWQKKRKKKRVWGEGVRKKMK